MACQFPPRDETLRFDQSLNVKYEARGYPERRGWFVDEEGSSVWQQQYLLYRTNGESHDQAQAHVFADIDAIWGTTPPPLPTPGWSFIAPITGYLRRAPNASFGDDLGPRSVRICSYFPALRDFRDRPDACRRNLDRMVGRWHGSRVFGHLADPWAPFGKDVRPFGWANFDDLFVAFLRECWARQLRVSLTFGDLQYLTMAQYEALVPRLAALAASVNEQVVALSGMVNEARVNSWSEVKDEPSYWAARSASYQAVYPWGQHGLSDPDGDPELPASLLAWSQPPATVALKHGTRSGWTDAIRRAFNVRYEGVRTIPIVEDEPTNMQTPQVSAHNIRVYNPLATKQEVFGLYSMLVLTGQLLTYFGDCSLTNTDNLPIDTDWGFKELPERWQQMAVPDDIGLYRLIPGHHADAPISALRFQVPDGQGPDRCDNMVAPDGSRGYAVAYGGSGAYGLFSRQPVREGRIWGPDGVLQPFAGTAAVPSAHQAVVLEWHR